MEFTTITDSKRATGTGFLAYMDIGYADIVATLGEPLESDGFKVDAEWILEFPGGTAEFPEPIIATIYNYKTGRNFLGPTAPATEDIRDWHIGGRDQRAVDRVAELFGPVATVSLGRIFASPVEPAPVNAKDSAAAALRAQAIIAALADADIPHDTMTGEALVALGEELIAEHTPEAGQPQVA